MTGSRFSALLLVLGIVALAAGAGAELLRWHHTLGYGALGLGALLTIAGVALAARSGALARKISALQQSRLLRSKKARAVVVVAIISGATLGTFGYAESQLLSAQSSGNFGITLSVDKANEVSYQDGSVGVSIHVTAIGGVPPYTFFASWGDQVNQTSTTGNFTRVFGLAMPAATELTITAESANKGAGFLSLLLPTEYPALNGSASTRTLTIVSQTAIGGQGGGAAASTTSQANTVIAVVNASTPTVQGTSTSVSAASTFTSTSGGIAQTTSTAQGFSLTVVVVNQSHQPVQGAQVTLDGGSAQTTDSFGKANFASLALGNHTIDVKSGSFEQSFPLTISPSSPSSQNMFVVI